MKILNCDLCKTKIGELATGSKIKKFTVFICKDCNHERLKNKKVNGPDFFDSIFR